MQQTGNKGTNRQDTQKSENVSKQSNVLSNCACRNHPFMEAYSRTVSKLSRDLSQHNFEKTYHIVHLVTTYPFTTLTQMTPSADECAKIIGRLNELYGRYPQYPQEFFGNVKGVQKRYLVNLTVNDFLMLKNISKWKISLFNELFTLEMLNWNYEVNFRNQKMKREEYLDQWSLYQSTNFWLSITKQESICMDD